MDSGILDADKINKAKSNWGENNKVYTRRFKKTTKTITTTTATSSPTATVTAVSPPAARSASPPTTPNNHQTLATNEANSEKQPTLSPVVEVSDDHSRQNRHAGSVAATGNGVIKPVIILVDNRVKINLKSAKSKTEIIELREKLRAEVDQIRRVARKLEDKEAELTAFSTVVGVTVDHDTYSHSQYSGNDFIEQRSLTRINSEIGSVTTNNIRPFRQLSVSVMNNNHNHGISELIEKEKRTPKANQYYRNSDFLLGKDRLPPENKRHKSNSGRKHSKESDYTRNQFKNCNNLLQRLMKHKHGWVFNEPVNAKLLGLHDYHDIIKHPMDLGTIKSRLAQNFYKSPIEFADDVRLTFHNAMTYNPKGQDVHVMAETLLNIFEERWAVIKSESNSDLRYGTVYDTNTYTNTNTPTSKRVPHFVHVPARMLYRSESMNLPIKSMQKPLKLPTSRTPVPKKPKAKDPNKRNMTYEEKQKLSTNLQSLPSEKLDNIVQIIKKKNSSLSQHDDEIEVDIDSVDIETLWELDRFVTNYKKSLSKNRKKAALAQQRSRVESGDMNRIVLENPATSMITDAPKEIRANEKTVEQGETRGDNGSRSSSSSSSSSDSGSSSSGSDSDTSSADGSDAGHSP